MTSRREFMQQAAGCALFPIGNEMHDTDQMLVNRANAMERALAQRAKKVEGLEAKLKKKRAQHLVERPKRYSIEFTFESGATPAGNDIAFRLPAQEKDFVVDGDTDFLCTELSTSLRVVGQANTGAAAGQFTTVTLPYDLAPFAAPGSTSPFTSTPQNRQYFLDFFWQVRDVGSDRDWQSHEQPSVFLLSGHVSPLFLPAPALIKGGSRTVVEIRPIRFGGDNGYFGLFRTVQSAVLHFSFHGASREVSK